MNRRRIYFGLAIVVGLLGASLSMGQTVIRHGGGGEGDMDILLLTELGIVVGMDEDSSELKVMVLLPDADPKMEIAREDLLLMINGKRVKDMAGLRAEYETAVVGDEVKVGFRRGDRRFLSSFEKKDPAAEQGTRRMVMIGDGEGDHNDMQPLTEFGVVLEQKEDLVVVGFELPMDGGALKEGDVLQSLNGTSISSLENFRSIYTSLATGAAIEVIAMRDGEEVRASGTKSDSEGQIRVRKGP
jgi:S1-C subfamily serine protease